MNNLVVKGMKNIEGMKFHEIEGGFGEGKKAMLVKEIANIHNRQEAHINEVINNNISRFKGKIDIINLLSDENFKIVVDDLGLKTSNRQKYSYLLSERGYSKLLKILEDDVAWEQYDKLVDGYFQMREERKNSQYQYENLSTEMKALLMHDKKIQAVQKEVLEVKEDIRYVKAIAEKSTIDYDQQGELFRLANARGTEILGGKNAPAYKSMSKKIFQSLWRDYKKYFKVNSYKNTAIKDYENAIRYIQNWHPKYDTVLDINMINRQVAFA